MSSQGRQGAPLFGRRSREEVARVARILRTETVGGVLLLAAAALALIWANSPWADTYFHLRDARVGPEALHLHLSIGTWAADGLLAIFFFVAGLEVKREFIAGDLRDPRLAALPVAAAVGGVAIPALMFTAVNSMGGGDTRGWAIPTATDIAFALAVLAVVGRSLPSSLRTFLLTLAVVDDLLAIAIIALFYTDHLAVIPLLWAALPLGLFAFLVQRRVRAWWLLLPLGCATWALVHASGIHATVAGVLLAFAVPVLGPSRGDGPGLAEHFEHRIRPLSAGIAVPVFALLSAGVAIGGLSMLRAAAQDPVAIGVVVGLVIGKPIGVLAATWVVARFSRATLDPSLSWLDVTGLAVLAGVGFTVSLLIGELAYGAGSTQSDQAKLAVLVGSLIAAVIATVLLRLRVRAHSAAEAAL